MAKKAKQTKKTATAQQASTVTTSDTAAAQRPLVLSVAFWGLAALLFVTPFFRGLFFAEEQYRALVFAAVLFWLVFFGRWTQRRYKIFEHPLDYLMLGLPVVYIYSAFFAVNTGLAVTEVAKNILYFLVFWITVRLVRSDRDADHLLKVIYCAAIAVALAGLATATGIIHIKDGFLSGRFYSSFQYPNALASYLMAGFFLGMYFWNRAGGSSARLQEWLPFARLPEWLAKTNPWPYLFALGNFIVLTVFIGAKSNGGFLVFILTLPLFFIFSARTDRIPYFWHLVLTAIPSAPAALLFIRSAQAGKPELSWLWVLLGLFVTLGFQALTDWWNRSLGQRFAAYRKTIIASVAGACTLAVIGAGIWVASNEAAKSQVFDITNAKHRIYSITDAFEMFAARPLTGWGGGGWQEAYQAFQNYHFITRQAHGHYAQIGVETGIAGIVLFVALWGVFLWANHRLYHGAKDAGRKALVLVVTVAGVAIGLHASIDFNLSLAALALVLWVLFGITAALSLVKEPATEAVPRKRKESSYVPLNSAALVTASVAAFIIISFGMALAAAGSFAQQGYAKLRSGDINGGIVALQKACAYNPFEGSYHAALAQAYQATGSKDNLSKAVEEARLAVQMSSYTPARYQLLANLLAVQGKAEDAAKYAEKAVGVAPLDVKQYDFLARTHFSLGYSLLNDDQKDRARVYLEKALEVSSSMEKINSRLTAEEKKLWQGAKLEPTPEMKLSLGASSYLLGKFDQAGSLLGEAVQGIGDDNSKAQAMLWLALVKEKQGKQAEANVLVEEAKKINPDFEQIYDAFKKLPLAE